MAVLRVYWRTIRHLNLRGYVYVWANLLWLLLSLPLITAPAAWAGLMRLSHKAQTQPHADLNDFWEGFRANLLRGALIAVLTFGIVFINVTNLLAFRASTEPLVMPMRVIWISIIVFWLSMQLYLWGLLEEMEQPTLIGGLRNAALMVLQNPLYTLGLWPGILLLVALSMIFIPAWFLLTGSAIAALGTSATLDRLRAAGYHNPEHYRPIDEPL